MKRIQLAVLAGGLALSAAALGNVAPQSGSTASGQSADSMSTAEGVVLVQRSVYVPVDPQGDVKSNDVLVVERKAFIPADELQGRGAASQGQSSANGASSMSASQAPDAVFVLVPSEPASAGSTAAAGGQGAKRVRMLDDIARNNPRCSDLSGPLPEECFAEGGTGASATASTQGQSGR